MSNDGNSIWQQCQETKAFIEAKVPDFKPEIGVILGSGLGNFGNRIDVVQTLPYKDIPHFKPPGVAGHSGNLIFGTIGERRVVCQQGRYHYYEGHTIQETVFPVRVMKTLGVETLVVSNAAGGINLDYRVGDIMMIRDHLNFQGANCLTGPNEDQFGPRFPDMSYGYAPEYRERLLKVAESLGQKLHQGVYLSVSGPSYETPAEINAFRVWGADAVGMSTVNEVIAANHCGIKCLGLSVITNAAAGVTDEKLDHEDVTKAVAAMGERFEVLVETWIRESP